MLKYHHSVFELARLEVAHVLQKELQIDERHFHSDELVDISANCFIQSCGEILASATSKEELFAKIAAMMQPLERVLVDYISIGGCPKVQFSDMQGLFKALAHIEGTVDRKNPLHHFILTRTEKEWIFYKQSYAGSKSWLDHREKPMNFSSAITQQFAQSLISLLRSAGPDFLDCGCGSGTSSLEACAMGLNVTAIDINEQMLAMTKANLQHFSYSAEVLQADATKWQGVHDSALVDFPYGLRCHKEDNVEKNIMQNLFTKVRRVAFICVGENRQLLESCGYEILQEAVIPFSNINRYIYHCQAGRSE